MPSYEEDAPCIYTCQGPPKCDMTNKNFSEQRQRNCAYCTVERLDINGVWHIIRQPSEC